MPTVRFSFLGSICVAAGVLVVPQRLPAQDPAAPPTSQAARPVAPEDVHTWVQDLDAQRFETRSLAMEHLVAAGGAAVEPVTTAVAAGGPETVARGVYVLRELALCGDAPVEEAALGALQRLAAMSSTPAARRSAEALGMLSTVRQSRAIKYLRSLGAKIETSVDAVPFTSVESLTLTIDDNWQGKPEDLRWLQWLRDARRVNLIGGRINDSWLETVANLTQLERLHVRRASITDQGLSHLKGLDKLQQLELLYCAVDDACIPLLQQLPSIQQIKLYGTSITQEGALRLAAAHPNVDVDHRRGAFLGVYCQPDPWPCEVTQVNPNSGAAKAGVQRGDVIIKFGDKPVNTFADLRDQIRILAAGDHSRVEVVRGGDQLSHNVPRRQGQSLGLEARTHVMGLEVTKVADKSCAAQAGLKPGDILVACQDDKVEKLVDLQALYDRTQPGEPLMFRYVRDLDVRVLDVTFGEWEE